MLDDFGGQRSDELEIPADLQSLHEQLTRDGEAWDTAQSDADPLAEHARSLAQTGHLFVPVEEESDDSEQSPTSPSLIVNDRLARSKHRRQRGLFPYVAVVALLALVGVGFSQFAFGHPKAHTGQALATATATDAIPTATDTATAMASAAPSTTPSGAGSGSSGLTVENVIVDTAPTTWTSSNCDPTMPFTAMVAFWTNERVTNGSITYEWLRSDGYVSDPITITYDDAQQPAHGASGPPMQQVTWDIPAAQGDGTTKWVGVKVLAPNSISGQGNLSLTCQFQLEDTQVGASPIGYDCRVLGDQTFTISGALKAGAGPGTNTVVYHWLRSTGVAGPDQTVTFGPGTTSVPVNADVWVVHQSDPQANYWDELVVTSPSGFSVLRQAGFSKLGC